MTEKVENISKKMATKKTTEKTEVKSKVKKTAEKKIESKVTQLVEQKVEDLPKVEPIEVPVEAPVKNPKVEPKQGPAGFEKKPSAGKQIRTLFESVIPKLTNEHLEILTSQEKTKEVLKIRYAFLILSTENKEDRKINGHCRYGSKTIEINGTEYWITNDLYERNIETFKKWCESLK